MGHGAISVYSGSVASGASTVSFDLGRSWTTLYADVGTMSTAVVIQVYAGASAGGNYRQVYHPTVNSATVVNNPYVISATVGSGGGVAQVPGGFRYLQFRLAAVVSGGVSFNIICSD